MRVDPEVRRWLEGQPTLAVGQADDLKVEVVFGESDKHTSVRIWLARTGVADGESINNNVSIEVFDRNDGVWTEIQRGGPGTMGDYIFRRAMQLAGYTGGGL
jgi:hypothetical protein